MPLEAEKARRIIKAVLENVSNWEQRIIEIEENANVGNKSRAIALLRDMKMAKLSLRRLADMDDAAD